MAKALGSLTKKDSEVLDTLRFDVAEKCQPKMLETLAASFTIDDTPCVFMTMTYCKGIG